MRKQQELQLAWQLLELVRKQLVQELQLAWQLLELVQVWLQQALVELQALLHLFYRKQPKQ